MHLFLFRRSLQAMALAFRLIGRLRREIDNPDTGFVFNARLQFCTRDGAVRSWIIFERGRVRTGQGALESPDVTIWYRDAETLARLYRKSPEESLDYLLTNEMSYTGNMACLTRFSYLTTLVASGGRRGSWTATPRRTRDVESGSKRRVVVNEPLGEPTDAVKHLDDPYLAGFALADFPRLQRLRRRRFAIRPAICVERARLLTEHHRREGFETDAAGRPHDRHLRQARAVRHILAHKRPIIWEDHLLAGSTCAKEVGVPVYPELIGTTIWPELGTIHGRSLNPNDLSPAEAEILDLEVFPYWMDRNVREHCRRTWGNPLAQQLEERFVLYFMMKNNAISHTVPGFGRVLDEGLDDTMQRARAQEAAATDDEARHLCQAIQIALEGVLRYAQNLSVEARRQASALDPSQAARRSELLEIARICEQVPAGPARTVHEAVMSIWIVFVCLHVENANSALSIGRLDQLLQPRFEHDIAQAATPTERRAVVARTIELVGSLFVKFNDHDPLVPNVGNKLFGGSSSDDTVTVGGVDADGGNAVNDMTFIILKTAEMLCFQDPNLNARFHPEVNSLRYLRRLCEVNINMRASPIIHNDRAMIEALVHQSIPVEHARTWAATGCVEPTISGKHYGHTNCMLLNLVAPLEMALHDGVHPVIGERIGPRTGSRFATYRDFMVAYQQQLDFLIEMSVEANNYLGQAHQEMHPTPLLSALFEGPLEKGRDLIDGGALYNTSGVALVALTDVVDSLMVLRQLVFEERLVDLETLVRAIDADFEGPEFRALQARISRVPKFGSNDPGTQAIARELIDHIYERYQSYRSYRGGKYLTGYWSISYHVGFGMLSGALPSGRRRGKAFTPGLTPSPSSSGTLLDQIASVAALDHLKMPNNIAFNVKLVPGPQDDHARTLDLFTSYVRSYFDLGGMQWQFNVISTDELREAMANPDDYRWLLVRVSGYNAYFVTLNRNMQEELVERLEFSASTGPST